MSSLWMIVASLAFALMTATAKLAMEQGEPVAQVIFYRCVVSLAVLYLVLRWRGIPVATPHWRSHLQRSLTGAGSFVAYFSALTMLPLATTVTLNYSSTLFVALLMLVMGSWQLNRATLAALIAGFAGIVLLLHPTASPDQWVGVALALGSAVTSALSVLSMRRLGELGESAWRTVFYFTLFTAVFTFPWYLSTSPWRGIEPSALWLLLGVGVLATIGQISLTHSYQRGNALVSSSLGYSQVLFSTLIGYLIWRDVPAGEAWIGIPLIIGSGIATLFLNRSPKVVSNTTPSRT